MKNQRYVRFILKAFSVAALLAFQGVDTVGQVATRLTFNGQPVFVKGVNLPWNNYGDFGNHYQWGNMYNSAAMESQLSAIAAKSFNTVRIWVYADGRTSPEWSAPTPAGSPTGHDSQFFANMDDFLQRCSNKNLFVILSLWDHAMLRSNPSAGQYAAHHESVITDSAKRAAWMNNVLGPLISRYANHARVLSWEVYNEPEWNCSDLPGGGGTDFMVTTSQMQQFLAEMNVKVHSYNRKDWSRLVALRSNGPPLVQTGGTHGPIPS